MAQSYKPGGDADPANENDPQKPGFHYYSGGEVKELENTRVSPLLWGFWSVVIAAAVIYLFVGGALGPHSFSGGFKPSSGSAASLALVQTDLNQKAGMTEGAKQADMTQLVPFLGGESLSTAVANGSNTYQSYCIGCHGPNQDGNGVNASSLNPKPRNLHDGPFMRETLNYQRINNSLHYGVHGTAMPRWENTLSEHEIQEVIAYALSLTWTMPAASNMDTTSAQLQTPAAAKTSPKVDAGMAAPGKSPSGSATGTAGGVTVQGGSVSSSPAPITPEVEGNPAAATSTAPPSQSGQPAAATGTVKTNTEDVNNASPKPNTQPVAPTAGNGM